MEFTFFLYTAKKRTVFLSCFKSDKNASNKIGLLELWRIIRLFMIKTMSNVLCVQPDGGDMQSEEGTEWLMELLTDVQLQQFFMRIRDELNVTRLSHFDYVKNEDLEKIGMGRPGECLKRIRGVLNVGKFIFFKIYFIINNNYVYFCYLFVLMFLFIYSDSAV